MGQTAAVKIEGVDSEPGIIGKGVRQGCPIVTVIVQNLHTKFDGRGTGEHRRRVKVGGHLVNAVRIADDQAMVANSKAGLQRIRDAQIKTTEEYGMKINTKKTKVMRISKNETKQMKVVYWKKKSNYVTLVAY